MCLCVGSVNVVLQKRKSSECWGLKSVENGSQPIALVFPAVKFYSNKVDSISLQPH